MRKGFFCFPLILFGDLITFYISLGIAYFFRIKILPYFISTPKFIYDFKHFLYLWWLPVIFLSFFAFEGLYIKRFSFSEELKHLSKAIFLSIIVIFSIVSLGKMSPRVSRTVLAGTGVIACFLFPFTRFWYKKLLYTLGLYQENALIVGAGRAGQLIACGLERDRHYGYKLVGYVDDDITKKAVQINGHYYPVLGTFKDLSLICKDKHIQTVILAVPSLGSERIKSLFMEIRKIAKHILIVPELRGISLLSAELDYLFYEELFILRTENNLNSPLNKIIKQTFDWIGGIIFFILTLPFLGIITCLIKISSPGPVFYTQCRVGKKGKLFKIYKFRTMYVNAEERLPKILAQDRELKEVYLKRRKIPNDPRITPIGHFLRKTSLDELPQIFNVLKGEMSLVGPRPALPEELEKYYKEEAQYYLQVKPGITGLWQVSGRNKTDFCFRVKIESWYVQNWCLWLDIIILLQTVKAVVKMEGAC